MSKSFIFLVLRVCTHSEYHRRGAQSSQKADATVAGFISITSANSQNTVLVVLIPASVQSTLLQSCKLKRCAEGKLLARLSEHFQAVVHAELAAAD